MKLLQDIETILLRTPSRFPLRPRNEADVLYRNLRPQYYNDIGMVNENGPKWHFLRSHLTPPLTSPATLKHYATHMDSISQDLVTLIRHQRGADNVISNFKVIFGNSVGRNHWLFWLSDVPASFMDIYCRR